MNYDAFLPKDGPRMKPSAIIETVADAYGFTPSDLTARCRVQPLAFARQVAMFLCRELTDESLVSIGMAFEGRDHGTVIHACTRVRDVCRQSARVRAFVASLRKSLASPIN